METIGIPLNVAIQQGVEGMEAYYKSAKKYNQLFRSLEEEEKEEEEKKSKERDEVEDAFLKVLAMTKKTTTASINQTPKVKQEPRTRTRMLLSPVDHLRLVLDEEWDFGACLGRNKTSRDASLGGSFRFMTASSSSPSSPPFIHVDDFSSIQENRGAFSANIYLQTPSQGGELRLWPVEFRSRWSLMKHASFFASFLSQQTKEQQEELLERMPTPITIKPDKGDLVMLCVQRPHCVNALQAGSERISMQTFLEFEEGKPLQIEV